MSSTSPSPVRGRRSGAVALALVALIGVPIGAPGAAFAKAEPALAPPAVCADSRAAAAPASGAAERNDDRRFAGEAFARTELFFGSEREGGPDVTAGEFEQFLDAVVTPCFPDGLTVLTGKGRFREPDGEIVQETSFVLVLLYPYSLRAQSDARIEAIRALYREHFRQESVLRVDELRAARVGF